ncbi:MAG: AAA family ATPase [Planctomycetota bacterium]
MSASRGRKIAVSGKGGAGKTTFVSTLAKTYTEDGVEVYAIDADPAANLAGALGYPNPDDIVPISEMRELIAERTESSLKGYGAFFKLNPNVTDIPEVYRKTAGGVHFLTVGAIRKGGGGCACPENTFLKALLTNLVMHRNEVVIVDMEAGIEHLGRATIQATDALIVIVEPGRQSVNTAHSIRRLARDIGMKRVFAVANKVRSDQELAFLRSALDDWTLLGAVRYQDAIARRDLEGRPPFEENEKLLAEVRAVRETLERSLAAGPSRAVAKAAKER